MNLPKLVSFHIGHPYYYPVVAVKDGKQAGFANGIIHGTIGWLGNIIVSDEYRRQGIGSHLTGHLIEYFKSKGCTTQLLIASDMGKNIYARAGFRESATYEFYKTTEKISFAPSREVRSLRLEEIGPIGPIGPIDSEATGEKRFVFLERFLQTARVFADPEIRGFCLPDYGNGLIVAKDAEAGIALLRMQLNEGKTTITIPSSNTVARDFLREHGFQKFRELPRMVLGKEPDWKPDMIFSRGSGYCG
jgi:ribosomal protein S18 acetylase RimI-like enzyme